MFDAIAETFQRASVDGLVRVEPLYYPKPSLLEALRSDPAVARYEAQFLKVLWHTRNDGFWIMNSEPRPGDLGWVAPLWNHASVFGRVPAVSGSTGAQPIGVIESETAVGTVQSPPKPPLRSPTLVTFDTEPVRLQYLVIPQLRNPLWREGADPRRAVQGVLRLRLGAAGRTVRRGLATVGIRSVRFSPLRLTKDAVHVDLVIRPTSVDVELVDRAGDA
jgi:hypothetical protein